MFKRFVLKILRPLRFERRTNRLKAECSTAELRAREPASAHIAQLLKQILANFGHDLLLYADS